MTEGEQFGTAAATRIDGPRIDSPGGPPGGPLVEPAALAAAYCPQGVVTGALAKRPAIQATVCAALRFATGTWDTRG